MKRYALVAVIVAVGLALIIGWLTIADQPDKTNQQPAQAAAPLQIDTNGSQIFTDVPGGQLQQATPPARSTTQAELNPQAAQPNYCTAGEIPGQDGCIVPNY